MTLEELIKELDLPEDNIVNDVYSHNFKDSNE